MSVHSNKSEDMHLRTRYERNTLKLNVDESVPNCTLRFGT